MNTKWNCKILEDAVRRVHGDQYANRGHEPLQSFIRRYYHALYHAWESKRVIKETLASMDCVNDDDRESIAIAKAALMSAVPDDVGSDIRVAQFKAEAHIIASAQALHSLCDILAGIIFWCYKLESGSKPPGVKRLNLHKIRDTLLKRPQYSRTAHLIDTAVKSEEFLYLRAYVNTTKHRSLIESPLSATFDSDDRGGMRIKQFTYMDRFGNIDTYDSKWAHDFLFIDNQSFRLKLVEVCNSLNEYFA